ncbi:MAG: hypothetical protein HY660_15315, partial [Armatimonadetes bacterium]|nr:hypothetical protein [Armatimonadota bacterium]
MWSRLRVAAWLALVIHLGAGVVLAGILRHGLETNPDLVARLRFLVDHRAMWIGAWLTWSTAALSVLYFYAAFAWAHGRHGDAGAVPLALAVMLSAAGVAPDLAAGAIEVGVLPALAHRALAELSSGAGGATVVPLFLALHRTGTMLAGYLANGLYTISAILLTWSTRHVYPPWVWIAGLGVGLSGLVAAGAALANSIPGMVWS